MQFGGSVLAGNNMMVQSFNNNNIPANGVSEYGPFPPVILKKDTVTSRTFGFAQGNATTSNGIVM